MSLEITTEQRNAIDVQIRERRLRENPFLGLSGLDNLPICAMLDTRQSLGLGSNLENACPYMRGCEEKTLELCLHRPYRDCFYYKINLASDFLDGKIDLQAVGIPA